MVHSDFLYIFFQSPDIKVPYFLALAMKEFLFHLNFLLVIAYLYQIPY